jgi:hypothetical protein
VRTIRLAHLAFAAVLCGCLDRAAGTNPPHPMSPENPVRLLSAVERAGLRTDIDVAALERLLARIPAQHRAEMLEFFKANTPRHRTLVGAEDPELDRLIKDVWEPHRSAAQTPSEVAIRALAKPIELLVSETALDAGAGAIVERTGGSEPDRIILSEATATSAQVFDAVRALAADRRHNPGAASRTIRVPPALPLPHTPAGRRTAAWLDRYLGSPVERLRSANRETVPGHGSVRRITLDAGAASLEAPADTRSKDGPEGA